MRKFDIKSTLKTFRGTIMYHKHLYPGKPPILITDGCKYIRDSCNLYWLFDAILNYQGDLVKQGKFFQIWELRQQRSDLSWLLTCKEDSHDKPLISQTKEFCDFPIEYIKILLIDNVALLPSEC